MFFIHWQRHDHDGHEHRERHDEHRWPRPMSADGDGCNGGGYQRSETVHQVQPGHHLGSTGRPDVQTILRVGVAGFVGRRDFSFTGHEQQKVGNGSHGSDGAPQEYGHHTQAHWPANLSCQDHHDYRQGY